MYNILICDDEKDIVKALEIYLSFNSEYRFFKAYDGRQAWEIIENNEIHLVLLDIMMPKLDGITLTSMIREKYNIPIILITAKSESNDIVLGLNAGADDYITKPFNASEVMARAASALRRYTKLGSLVKQENVYVYEGLYLDDNSKEVRLDDQPVALTPTEFAILKLLIRHPGKVFSTADIYSRIWGDEALASEQSIAVHIRHLREKIEINPSQPRYLQVIWGQGYCLKKKGAANEK